MMNQKFHFGGWGGRGGGGVSPIGRKSLQVPAIPLPLPTPALVQPLHPQLLLGLAHRQAGGGVGRGCPETKLEAPSAS